MSQINEKKRIILFQAMATQFNSGVLGLIKLAEGEMSLFDELRREMDDESLALAQDGRPP